MLTASQVDVLRTAAEQLLDPVTNFLIEDIARRVAEAGQLTSTAAYQVWRAQKLGVSQKKLKKELQEKLKVSEEELEKLLKQAAKTGYNFDLSRLPTSQGIPFTANSSIQQIVDAAVRQAKKDLTNITRTMGFVGSDGKARELTKAYKKACDDAFMRTVTGAQDYNSAIREAMNGLADKGIVSIDYSSGKHFTVEAAVRQNIMGGLGLMQEQISEKNHDDMGCDGWEISAHAASAPDHEPIQGKQYSDKAYKALNDSLLRRIGTLNCGHAAFPIILGVHSPQYTEEELEEFRTQNEKGVTVDGRHYTAYEATQRQRKLERAIRNQKRKILIDKTVDDPDKLQTDQIKLVRLRDEYARFSKAAGLPTQHARAEAAGFTWKDGKEAEAVNKQVEREKVAEKARLAEETARRAREAEEQHVEWLRSIGAENTTLTTLDKLNDARYNNTEEYQLLMGYSKAVEKQDISPLVGFELYKQTAADIQEVLVGQETSTGVEIQSFATHFIDRVIGQTSDAHNDMRQGVSIADVLDALKNPASLSDVRELSNGDVRQTFYGERAAVTVSIRDHRLIQTNPMKGKKKK